MNLLKGTMFERFRVDYAPLLDRPQRAAQPWQERRLLATLGYPEFASEFAGASFGGGLYRVHDQQSGIEALTLVTEAFPDFARRVCPFGYDWLGRQFAIDSGRTAGGQQQILMLEPGTGEALEIPVSFVGFHDEALIEYADAALATEFWTEWSTAHHDQLPLAADQCVGYQIPLFLGGLDELSNLEVTDISVYWTLFGQLRSGVIGRDSD